MLPEHLSSGALEGAQPLDLDPTVKGRARTNLQKTHNESRNYTQVQQLLS